MTRSRPTLVCAVLATLTLWPLAAGGAAPSIPDRIGDSEFWGMVVGLSEDGGSFVSDNIISNEIQFQRVIPELQATKLRGVYFGVGPEQNFTYITALRPSMAFIFDIRRGNLLLHLTYKAVIELSADRLDFMSRVFARRRPAGIGRASTARALFDAFAAVPVDDALAQATSEAIVDRLGHVHGFSLSDDDKRGIEDIYRSLYVGGPNVRGDFGGGSWIPSYAELMAQTDLHGRNHSFVESEQSFRVLKEYESRNLIVPLVGDFAGPKAIRAVGRYVTDHRSVVATFYTSNVEDYLFRGGAAERFFANVTILPISPKSMFIRAFFTRTDAGLQTLLDPMAECLDDVAGGHVRNYADLISRSRIPRP